MPSCAGKAHHKAEVVTLRKVLFFFLREGNISGKQKLQIQQALICNFDLQKSPVMNSLGSPEPAATLQVSAGSSGRAETGELGAPLCPC